ncbi:uncharacterized protein isoform X2 [Choristoneura fumiferana]
MLTVMETFIRDLEDYGFCNLKVPDFSVDIDEDVFEWHVKGHATFTNSFVASVQNVDIIQHTVQQIWRFNATDNTTSVFVQASMRMLEVSLGYDVRVELDDGSRHYYTGIFKHNVVTFPFAVIYNMFTDEYTATVTMDNLPTSTNRMVFAPVTALTQVLSHLYDVTSAVAGMGEWGPNVFQPLLLNVAQHKVPFAEICYNCPTV